MATALDQIEPTSDPGLLGASEFWQDMNTGRVEAHIFMARYTEILSKYEPGEESAMETEVNQLLADELSYATTWSLATSQYETLQKGDLAFWSGRYGMVGSSGQLFEMVIDQDVVLNVGQRRVPVTAKFEGGKLSLTAPTLQAELTMQTPAVLASLESGATPVADSQSRQALRCSGTLAMDGDAPISVSGKRDAFTHLGIASESDGDPVETWMGTYALFDMGNDTGGYLGTTCEISVDSAGAPHVRFAQDQADTAVIVNNILRATFADGRILAAVMDRRPDGATSFLGLVGSTTQSQRIRGSRVTATHKPVVRSAEPHLFAAYSALGATAPDVTGVPVAKINVMSSVEELPMADETSPYWLVLEASNLPSSETGDGTWSYIDADSPTPSIFDLTQLAGSNGRRALFRISTGETQVSGIHKVRVSYQVSGKTAHQVTLKIEMQSLQNMELINSEMPEVVRDCDYVVKLMVNGGLPPYSWSEDISGLPAVTGSTTPPTGFPPGLTFDAANGIIKGKVTAESASQRVYSVGLVCKGDPTRVIIQPLKVTLFFKVVEPTQLYGTDRASVWLSVGAALVGAIGIFVTGGYWCYRKFFKKEALKSDTVIEMNTIGDRKVTVSNLEAVTAEQLRVEKSSRTGYDKAIQKAKDVAVQAQAEVSRLYSKRKKIESDLAAERGKDHPDNSEIDRLTKELSKAERELTKERDRREAANEHADELNHERTKQQSERRKAREERVRKFGV